MKELWELYADENFPQPVVLELRNMGVDVLTALEAEQANRSISDLGVLNYADSQGRVVVTLNRRDFRNLHSENTNHSGIIICTDNRNHQELAERIVVAMAENDPLAGKLIRVYRPDR